jgi:hypothetical protein
VSAISKHANHVHACSCLIVPTRVQGRIDEVIAAIKRAKLPLGRTAAEPLTVDDYGFKHEPADYNVFWDVRKGLIPIFGAAREAGAGPRHALASAFATLCLPAIVQLSCCSRRVLCNNLCLTRFFRTRLRCSRALCRCRHSATGLTAER